VSWRLIDTAPLDGTPVDLWVVGADAPHYSPETIVRNALPEGRLTDVRFFDGKWRTKAGVGRKEGIPLTPTYWMPRPDAAPVFEFRKEAA
jgi:hypothetical protein